MRAILLPLWLQYVFNHSCDSNWSCAQSTTSSTLSGPVSGRKRAASPDSLSSVPPRIKKRKFKSAQLLTTVTESLFKVTDSLGANAVNIALVKALEGILQPIDPTTHQCTQTIHIMEDDGEFSENEQISIIELFEDKPHTAATYASIWNKSTRTSYIQHALDKHIS